VLDNLHRDALTPTGLREHPNVRVVVGDVRDREVVEEAARGAELVVHMAAIAGVDTVCADPVRTMETSLVGSINVLHAAYASGTCTRFLDFSTSEVFGRYAYRVQEADQTSLGAVGEARWTYAVSKLATEHLVLSYHKQFGFPACSIRPFNVYGPRQVGEGAVHHFIVRALRGEELIVHNDGSQIRPWCYVDDMIEGILLCLTHPLAPGNAFNIGNPRSTLTIYELAREVVRLAASSSPVRFVDRTQVDVELRVPDVRKAREMLGFMPAVELAEGLAATIRWYEER
jgi:nucleoside-diphosphate-sugar epimerase